MGKIKFDSENIDFEELSRLCVNFSGADIKSVVCDALVKAFHRVTAATNNATDSMCFAQQFDNGDLIVENLSENLISLIRIEKNDLMSSIESIKQTINEKERNKMRLM
jgi:SpoVK/Ycf46/Vps4 family AAA+-type ATPase